jgi:hypothetical protein
MLNATLQRIGTAIARFLATEVQGAPPLVPYDYDDLRRTLRPGDVLLIDGTTRISLPIKYLTQSTWSHAALFLGPIGDKCEADGEPHVLIEAELIEGVRSSPLSRYHGAHTRICRPIGLTENDASKLGHFATERIGQKYDLRNMFDLARFLLPAWLIPARLRRRSLALGAGDPTRAICSTLIAQAFQSIHYPILPIIEQVENVDPLHHIHAHVMREIMRVRNCALYVPRDFDISPYFSVVKPMVAKGFDFHVFPWAPDTPCPGRRAGEHG